MQELLHGELHLELLVVVEHLVQRRLRGKYNDFLDLGIHRLDKLGSKSLLILVHANQKGDLSDSCGDILGLGPLGKLLRLQHPVHVHLNCTSSL